MSRISTIWLVFLAGFLPASVFAQTTEEGLIFASVERVTGHDAEEIAAYEELKDRFSERTAEFHRDVARFIETRKEQELSKISDGYNDLIASLERAERDHRLIAIEKLTRFLDLYPGAEDADNIRFRLAELLYEQSIEDWLNAQERLVDDEEAYDQLVARAEEALENGDPSFMEDLPEPPESPKKDLGKSIDLYWAIVANNENKPREEQWQHLDRAYYSLGYAYRDREIVQHDFELSENAFFRLVQERPESDLADAAHMFLGNLMFNEKKDFDGSIEQYKAVIAKGAEQPYYYDASFQLAWTYYKLAGKDTAYEAKALELFTSLLDDSERQLMENGKESDYAPDARLNMARTLADIADRSELNPVYVAERFFGQVGERPWEKTVYLALAEILAGCVPVPDPCPAGKTGFGRFEIEYAIDVYEKLQTDPRWVTEAVNPSYQRKIIWLLPHKLEPNIDVDMPEEQRTLVDRYGEQIRDPMTNENVPNPWWVANRNNPDALDQVRQFIENSLADVAVGLMREAQGKNDADLYRAAATKFREYMNKFPIADNYFEHQWYLANALMVAAPKDPTRPWGPYEEALDEFRSLIGSASGHPYGDGAVFQAMSAQKGILLAKEEEHGRLDELPKSAVQEKTIETEFGKTLVVYSLSSDHRALIESMDGVLAHEFGPSQVEGVPDYREVLAKNEAYLKYTPGLILYYHNRYEEARERLKALFDSPELVRTKEASFAARLVVDSYTKEGDLASVRRYTSQFLKMPFPDEDIEKFDAQNRQSALLQAKVFIDKGDRDSAAKAFESYMEEYPDTTKENYRLALYNAANSYDIVGKAERANQLFEKYVEIYPSDDVSKKLYMRIAGNYEAVFDLEKALYYYKELIDNDPRREYAGTVTAQYNTAFLKIGLGDHRGAAQGFEAYARLFPDEGDVEDVYFKAGSEWEAVSDSEAIRFYDRYQKKFPNKNPDHIIAAQYAIASIYKKQGRTSAYRKQMDKVQATFDKFKATGLNLNASSKRAAAERAFQLLEIEYAKYATGKMVRVEAKDIKMLETKDGELPGFQDKARGVISQYGDFEYGLGSFYLMASAQLFIAELGYSMECPKKYSEEECEVWYEIFEEEYLPMFDEYQEIAVSRYENLISLAKDKGRHTHWVDKAYETLNRLDPFTYPAIKDEINAELKPQTYPEVMPVSAEIPVQKEEKGKKGKRK